MTAFEATPGYNRAIPEDIMTPDRVETSIGTLEFFDGLPSAPTVEKAYDFLDLIRGVETFLTGMPAASMEAVRRGMVELGVDASNKAIIADRLLDSMPLLLTGNTDTVYCSTFLDLEKAGPTVVEIPPGCGPGTVNDAFFRFVIDMGVPGPDRGQGGKYLLLPPEYEGELAPAAGSHEVEAGGTKYFVARSTSHVNWLVLRGFLVDGKPDAATATFESGLKVYPLAAAADPPAMQFTSVCGRAWNTIHPNTFAFYEELDAVIQREPVAMLDPELRGLFAAVGIEKGKPFAPDARMEKILSEAVAIANATARAIVFRPRLDGVYLYPGSAWATPFVGGSYEWLVDGGLGGRNLDARTLFFYAATVNTPAMAMKMVGKGSQYAYAAVDSNGDYLDGAKSYTLRIPADAPAQDFWSVVLNDSQTRSMLQTGQPFPSKDSKRDALLTNADGSVDVYFGPTAPDGKEANWIETVPGKGWFAILRMYGPLEPWFDKSWRPGAIEPAG